MGEDEWAILFSHPRDFTDVCATELGKAAELKDEWDKRNIKVVGLSVDSLDNHNQWIEDIKDICDVEINFPIIADPDRKIALLYGMLEPTEHSETIDSAVTVRSLFIISPDKEVKLIITYPS